jgi:hypothetical protein
MRAALCLLILLAGCRAESPTPKPKANARARASAPAEASPGASAPEALAEASDAAATLRRYYAAIEARDYDTAWAMRSGPATDAERQRFAANFKAYERYRATVGVSSEPVEAGGWAYVEVPVMIYGSYRGGKPFGSSGSVSLRRATSAPAAPRERRWHIYTQ